MCCLIDFRQRSPDESIWDKKLQVVRNMNYVEQVVGNFCALAQF